MKTKCIAVLTFIVLSITGITSCSGGSDKPVNLKPKIIKETATHIEYSEYSGKIIKIRKKPKRVVILFSSLLDLWYFSGGKAIARVEGKINVPKAAENIEIVGTLGNPNLEKIISLKPDLVIINREMRNQRKIESFLRTSKIQFIEFSYINYHDFLFIADLFFRINGNNKSLSKIEKIRNEVNSIIAKCPDSNNPLAMITFASSNNVTAELPAGDTGTILSMLKGRNIATKSPINQGSRVDLSIEKITVMNPDIMLVKMMGKQEKVKAKLDSYFKNNSSLKEIKAIKENRIYYLPRKYFMYKPNARYPEAFRYLAEILYPEIFKKK